MTARLGADVAAASKLPGRRPTTYLELMPTLGTPRREILGDFDKLYPQGRLKRLKDGGHALNGGA